MVLVPSSTLQDARDLIDELEYEVAMADSVQAAREAYWQEVYAAQELHIQTLRKIMEDMQGSTGKKVLDNALWLLGGYGLRAALE